MVEGPVPRPRRRQVRIRVRAAGVAFGDVMRRRGILAPRRPFTPGYDVAGVVDAIGANVSGWRAGDRVACMMPRTGIGGYADHVCVPASRLVRVPNSVPADEAVSLGLNYITAYQMLHRLVALRAGQRILVHGAAGGVGSALLELGGLLGLEMYGTASSRKHDLVRERGAVPIDYRNEDFVARIAELCGDGIDAVYDGIGGEHLEESYRTLRSGGTLVAFGISGDLDRGLPAVIASISLYLRLKLRRDHRHARLYGIGASPQAWPANCRSDWQTVLGLRVRGLLAPVIGARIPLDEVARAHDLLDRAAVMGKIVLTT